MGKNYIHGSRLYKVEHRYKGNGEWHEETLIVVGHAMRANGYHLERYTEYWPEPSMSYRLHDGRPPEYQPVCDGASLRTMMTLTYPGINVASIVV